MKKNKMMRLASVLLILTLLSTSVISGTFAKYVTTDSSSDSARVAKWGVSVTAAGATGSTAFQDEYDTAATETEAIAAGVTTSVKTSGAADDSLVAPGTTGTLATYDISGTPEVAVRVQIEATMTLSGWEVTDDWDENAATAEEEKFYCPIYVTIGSDVICGLDFDSAAAFIAAVEAKIDDDDYYGPNTTIDSTKTVTWTWAFADRAGTVVSQNDKRDTALGNLEADSTNNITNTIDFALKVTVTQVD